MAKARTQWVFVPPKPPKVAVPEAIKQGSRAHDPIEIVLKPQHVKPAPEDERCDYILDLSTKRYRRYFYFPVAYRNPGPVAITPTFETRFARLE